MKHLVHEFSLPLQNPVLVFSLILFIILLSPILLKKLNIPGIIGLIISGVIVGPFGLNLLEKNSAIQLFSTIGLLYIMFIAGLELDMNQFKANRNKSLLFGVLTFIIPFVVGYPVCFYLLNYDVNASLLTASMFATHTLVAYPIVSKLGISKNEAVAVTVGGTIIADTAALIILAVILGNSRGDLNSEFWITLVVSLVVFTAFMFFVIPKIAKWFFQKLESEKHSHYIFVLSVVFFAAFLAELAGVESIIGAFVAGLALNRLIPHSSALMNRIEFIGNALFIPFFLISVGMLVDIRVILNGTTALIVASVLLIAALFGKWLTALITQLLFKYSSEQRQLIYGLSSARAAATLAIVLVGYKAKILDENILNGTIILILITCIIASFVTEKAAKKILISTENEIPEELKNSSLNQKTEQILIPIADLSSMDKLLEFALLIKDKKSENPISILSVVPNNHEAEKNIITSRNKLEEYVKQASASEVKANIISTIDHNAASGIARTSREIMADLVVIGWPRKTGFIDKLIGEKIYSIIKNVDKNLSICHFEKPIIAHKRIVLISPPLVERENNFHFWVQKIATLGQELSLPIYHYGDLKTHEMMDKYYQKNNISIELKFNEFTSWSDFLILSKEITNDDLIVLISPRKGALSYINALENIPQKLENYFNDKSKIIFCPQQSSYFTLRSYNEVSSEPLVKGLEALENIGKGISGILSKKTT